MPPQNILYYHLNHLAFYIAGFLNQRIYALQHMLKNVRFYLVYVEVQPLAVLLCCNTYHMER